MFTTSTGPGQETFADICRDRWCKVANEWRIVTCVCGLDMCHEDIDSISPLVTRQDHLNNLTAEERWQHEVLIEAGAEFKPRKITHEEVIALLDNLFYLDRPKVHSSWLNKIVEKGVKWMCR